VSDDAKGIKVLRNSIIDAIDNQNFKIPTWVLSTAQHCSAPSTMLIHTWKV
jgi:hypothetical protein